MTPMEPKASPRTFSKVAQWALFRVLLAPQIISLAVLVLLDHTVQIKAWMPPNCATQALALPQKPQCRARNVARERSRQGLDL